MITFQSGGQHENALLAHCLTEPDIEGGVVTQQVGITLDRALHEVGHCFTVCALWSSHMIARKQGVILSTSSVDGLIGERDNAVYAASKGAIISMSRAMAADYARYGIRVNTLCPGWIDTPINDPFFVNNPAAKALAASYQPLGRLGLPVDIASAAAFLCSDDASFITGTALVVDGGFTSTWLETPPES